MAIDNELIDNPLKDYKKYDHVQVVGGFNKFLQFVQRFGTESPIFLVQRTSRTRVYEASSVIPLGPHAYDIYSGCAEFFEPCSSRGIALVEGRIVQCVEETDAGVMKRFFVERESKIFYSDRVF